MKTVYVSSTAVNEKESSIGNNRSVGNFKSASSKRMLGFLAAFLLLLSCYQANAAVYTWTNNAGGVWGTSSNWTPARSAPATTDTLVFDGNSGGYTSINVTGVPTTGQTGRIVVSHNTGVGISVTLTGTSGGITLQNGGIPLAIASGDTLQLSTLSLTIGTATGNTVNINGELRLNTGGSFSGVATTTVTVATTGAIRMNGGTYTATNTATTVNGMMYQVAASTITSLTTNLTFSSTGLYRHQINGGAIPVATWSAGSICRVTGITTTTPTAFAGTFSNLYWNSTSQTVTANMTGAVTATNFIDSSGAVGTSTQAVTFTNTTLYDTLAINGATSTKALGNTVINSGGAVYGTVAATVTANGGLAVNAGGIWSWATAAATSVTINGNLSIDGTFTNSVATPYTDTANVTINSGATFTPGTGVFTISGTSGVAKTLGGTISSISIPSLTVTAANLTNNIPTLTVGTALAGTGTLTMGANTTLNLGGTFTTGISITTLNCTTNTPNTVVYNGASPRVKGNMTYHNLTSSVSGSDTLQTAAITINGSFQITSGTFVDNGFAINGNSTSGNTFSIASGAQFTTTKTTTPWLPSFASPATISLDNNSNVRFNGAATLTAAGLQNQSSFGNLIIGAAITLPATFPVTVNGSLTIAGTLADNGNTITVIGNVTNTSTHSGAGKILLTGGSASHTLTGTPAQYGRLELDDANGANLSSTGTCAINQTLTITNGTLTLGAFTASLTVTGITSISSTGGITLSSVTGSKTFTGDITINGTWNNSGNSPVTMAGNLIVNSGAVFTSGTGAYTLSGTNKSISGTLVTSSASPLLFGGNVSVVNDTLKLTYIKVAGVLSGTTVVMGASDTLELVSSPTFTTLNATTNTPNAVVYSGSGINAKNSATTYFNLVINSAGTVTQASGAATVNNRLNILSGTFADGGLQIVGTASTTLNVANGAGITFGAGGATTTNFPTGVTQANTTLGSSSTVTYNTTSAVTISAVPSSYGNLVVNGASTKTIGSAATINGTITISAGRLNANAAISGTPAVTLNGAAGDTLATSAIGGAGTSQTFGLLTMTDNATIALGTGLHTLTFGDSPSLTAGKYLTITGWAGNWDGTSGTAGEVFFGATNNLTAPQLALIKFIRSSDGTTFNATQLGTGEVVPASQASKGFVSVASTAWNLPTTWGFAAGTAVPGVNVPGPADSVTIASTHNVTLAAATTVTTLTFASTGTLTLNGFAFTTGKLDATANATITGTTLVTVGGDNSNSNFAGNFASTAQLTKTGTGTLTLTGTSGSTGAITVSNGTLKLGTGTTLADAVAVTVNTPGILDLNAANETIGTLAGTGTVQATSGNDTLTVSGTTGTTFSGIIQNGAATSLALRRSAASGIFILSGANTYSGGTILSGAGTLNINNASAIGTGTLTITAAAVIDNTSAGAITLTTNNPMTWNSNFTFTGTQDLNMGTGAVSMNATRTITTTTAAKTLTIGGIISGSTFGITKAGAGILALNGANTYNGIVTISAGTLATNLLDNGGNASGLGQSTNAATNLILNGGTFQYTGAKVTTDRLFSVGTSGGTIDASGSDTLTFGNTASMAFNGVTGARTLTLTGTGVGVMSVLLADNTGATAVTKAGNGTWIITNNNTNTGVTAISAGTLKLGSAGSGSNTPLGTTFGGTTIASGATLDLNGYTLVTTEAITSINGSGVGGAGAITNTSANPATFNGAITLAGSTSILTNAGDINLGGAIAMGTSIGTLTIGGSGNGSQSGIISGSTSSALIKTGNGTWTLSGANSYSTVTNINGGTIKLNNATALGTTGTNTIVAAGAVLDLNGFNYTTNAEALTINGTGISGSGAVINSSASGVRYAGALTLGSSSTIKADNGYISFTSATAVAGTGFTLTLDGNGAAADTIGTTGTAGGLNLSTNGALIKNGSSTWCLAAGGTYTGATTVNSGTLRAIGATSAFGSGSAVTLANTAGVTLDLNNNSNTIGSLAGGGTTGGNVTLGSATLTTGNANNTQYDGVISGTGGITKQGAGIWTLTGNNSYSGLTSIVNGIIKVGATGDGTNGPLGTIGRGTTLTANAGTLDLNGFTLNPADTITLSGTGYSLPSNNGGIMNSNASAATYNGNILLAAASTIGGATSVGAINIADPDSINGATFLLTLAGPGGGSVSSSIRNTSGGVTVSAGTWTLSGESTYTGATNVSAGATLKLGATGTSPNTPLGTTGTGTTVASGGCLDLNGINLATAEGLTISGRVNATTGALINSSSTPATYQGAITLGASAAITTNAGDITLSSTASIGSTVALTLGGSGNINANGVLGTASTAGILYKIGSGTLNLNAANIYTGVTTDSAGVIKLGNAQALGTNAAGTTVLSGAAIDLNGINYTTAEALNLNGTGVSTSGVLYNGSASAAAFAGPITLQSNSTIKATSGDITLNNATSIAAATFALTLDGSFNGTISGATNGITGTTASVTKNGTGNWTLTGQNTFTGAVTINAGQLILGNANRFAATAGPTVNAMTLAGGTFSTGASTGYTDSLGVLTLSANSNIQIGSGSHRLYFSPSNGATWPTDDTLRIYGWTGATGRIYVGNSSSGLTTQQLTQVLFNTGTLASPGADNPAQIEADGEITQTSTGTNYYRSAVASGNWSAAASWETSTDSSTWGPATFIPSASNSVSIVIKNGHAITMDVTGTDVDQMFIETGGSLAVGANTLNVLNGSGTDLIVNGTLSVAAGVITAAASSQIDINGTFTHTGTTTSAISAGGAGVAVNVNGLFQTTSTVNTTSSGGFTGAATTAISSNNSPTVTLGAYSNIEYNGGAQFITARSDYSNLTISTAGLKTFVGATTINDSLTINNGSSATDNGQVLTGNASTGAFILNGTASYTTTKATSGATFFPSNVTSFTISNTSTVIFSPSATPGFNLPAVPTQYGNLTLNISGSTTQTKTMTANITVNGQLSLVNNIGISILAINGNTLTLNGVISSLAGSYAALSSTTAQLTGSSTSILNIGGTVASTIQLPTTNSIKLNQLNVSKTTNYFTLTASVDSLLGTSPQLTVAANALFDATTSNIAFGSAGGTVTINGTLRTSSTAAAGALSGTATSAVTNANSPSLALGAASTIEYYGATAGVNSRADYNNLVISTAGIKAVRSGGITVNGNLTINAGATLVDSGYQVTGNTTVGNTLTMGAGAILVVGGHSTTMGAGSGSANATTLPVFNGPSGGASGYAFNAGSFVYYASSNASQVISNVPFYGNLNVSSNAASLTKALSFGTTNVAGTYTGGTNTKLDMAGDTLNIQGATPITSGSLIDATNATSNIVLSGSSAATSFTFTNAGGGNPVMANLTLNKTNTNATLTASNLTITGNLRVATGNKMIFNGINLTLNGYVNPSGETGQFSATSGTLNIGGTTGDNMGTIIFDLTNFALTNFTMNRTGGSGAKVVIVNNFTVQSAITLTSGIVDNDLYRITSLGTTSTLVTATSASWITGEITRTFLANLTSGTTWLFPVGLAGIDSSMALEMVNPTTNATALTITAKAITMAQQKSTTNGFYFGAGSDTTARLWKVTTSSAGLTSAGTVRLKSYNDPAIGTLSGINAIGFSTTNFSIGAYTSLGGASVGSPANTISTSLPVTGIVGAADTRYFLLGEKQQVSCGPYAVGSSPSTVAGITLSKLTNVAQLLNTNQLTCDVVFEVNSGYSVSGETFPVNFYAFNYDGSGPYEVTIRPRSDVASAITINGSSTTNALISFNGTSRVTIDGRPGGTGSNRYLTFRNSTATASTTGPVFQFDNSSATDTLEYCNIESNSSATTSGALTVGATGSNTGLFIDNNYVRSASADNTGSYATGVYSNSASNSNITVSNNHFYFTQNGPSTMTVINFATGIGSGISITGNYIGGQAANAGGSAMNHSGFTFKGISVATSSSTTTNILNNKIGNYMTTFGFSGTGTFTGIDISGTGNANINSNTVGHPSNIGDILLSLNGIQAGIKNSSSGTISIANDTVGGISDGDGLGSSIRILGIQTTAGVNTISGNVIRSLQAQTNAVNGVGSGAAVIGIWATSTSGGQTISANEVRRLVHTINSSTIGVTGIAYTGPTSGNNVIERNFVHSFNVANTINTTLLTGILVYGTSITGTVKNNMVRLGLQSDGSTNTSNLRIEGIKDSSTAANSIFFNSVYIGGSGAGSSAVTTSAFRRETGTGADSVYNNIFFNARSVSFTGSKNYAIQLASVTGIKINYNDLYVTGSNGIVGFDGTADRTTLSAWRTANPTFDVNSYNDDPQFKNATGTTSTVDLHLSYGTPNKLESRGLAISNITDDYDGQLRANLSPTDIGADADTLVPYPIINYTAIPNNNSAAYVFSGVTASITAPRAIDYTAGVAPRVYYKKTSQANDSASWKYVETTTGSSPFSFTFNYSLLGGASAGDTIQYFVVAQDNGGTPAMGVNTAVFTVYPATVSLTSAAFPVTNTNSFIILPGSGAVTVGTGGTYPSFTTASGLFKAINDAGGLTGDMTATVVGDMTEDGTNVLNAWGGGYKLRIVPGSAVLKNINGPSIGANGPMIGINGADSVTIDGSYNGSGQYLMFRDTNATPGTAGAAIQLYNGSVNDSILNCKFESNATSTTLGVITIGTGTNTGVVISGNDIGSATRGSTLYYFGNGIYSNNASNSSITVSNNSIHCQGTGTTAQVGINLTAGNSNVISGNKIGGSVGGSGAAVSGVYNNTMSYAVGGTSMHTQFIYTASDLINSGLSSTGATINKLGWSVASNPSNATLNNYTIRMKKIPSTVTTATGSESPTVSFSGTTMTVTATGGLTIDTGMVIRNPGGGGAQQICCPCGDGTCSPYNYITSFGTGNGGTGTYNLAYTATTTGSISANILGGAPPIYRPAEMVTVKNAFNYTPTPVGLGDYDMITLDNPFVWDGTSNVIVDVYYTVSGSPTITHRGYTVAAGYTFNYVSSPYSSESDATGNINSTPGNKPMVKFGFQGGGGTLDTTIVGTWTSSFAGNVTGILLSCGTGSATTVDGNIIKNFNLTSTASSVFRGIQLTAGAFNVGSTTGNVIGDTAITSFNSITGAGNGTAVTGIYSTATAASTIANNHVANMQATGTGTGVKIEGITHAIGNVAMKVNNNSVKYLTTTSTNTGNGASAAVIGIHVETTANNDTISRNKIHTLRATGSAAVHAVGLETVLGTSGCLVDRNFIHSFNLPNATTSGSLEGIYFNTGNANVQNNMVRLGIKDDGTGITTGYAINGFNEPGTNATVNNYYFNSVYIGGNSVTASQHCYGLVIGSSSTTARSILNNIFYNVRDTSGSIYSYAMKVNNTTNLTSDYNDLVGTGTNVLAVNTTNYASLAAWRTGTGKDAASISYDPAFVNATGNNGAVNLHVQSPTPVEGIGFAVGSVTDDYDGDLRASNTPTDIGADAGGFTNLDVTPPVISYTALTDTVESATRYLVNVSITDATAGVNTTAGTKPRLYYKKATENNAFNGNNPGDNGWKYVEANNSSSPFEFTIDYSILTGGSATYGTVIQYFVVAQDVATSPNVSINSGTFAATPGSVALTSGAFPIGGTINQYKVLFPQGTTSINVGVGEPYTSLSRTDGAFAAINSSTLTANLTINVTSDISIEDGAVGLNEFAAPYTVTIQSSAAALRTLYNSTVSADGMIRLNGADRVTISGYSSSNNDRLLLFRNTSGNSVIKLQNSATNNVIKNVITESGKISNGVGSDIGSGGIFVAGNYNSVSTSYTAANTALTYSSTSGGVGGSATVGITTNWINGVSLGFNFVFEGNTYTSLSLSSNGYAWFGSGSPAVTGVDLFTASSLGTNVFGMLAPIATAITDNGTTNSYAYVTTGSAPYRVCTIEMTNKIPVGANGAGNANRIDFEIKLYETTNNIEFVYKDQSSWTTNYAYSFGAGIRGANGTSDFVNVKQAGGNFTPTSASPGTANTDKVNFASGDHFAADGNGSPGIRFTYASLTSGNDKNSFQYCDLRNYAAGDLRPCNTFLATGTVGEENDSITIDNCNIYNFDYGTSTNGTYGINVGTGNGNGWVITNNKIYRGVTSGFGPTTCINFTPGTAGSGATISNNQIGSMGAFWPANNIADSYDTYWYGIVASVGTGATTVISNNVIDSVQTVDHATWAGISIQGSGNVDVTNNTLYRNGGSWATNVWGISNSGSGTVNITGNTINYLFTQTNGSVYGITKTSGGGTHSIKNNTVRRLINQGTNATTTSCGIRSTSGAGTINNNEVFDIACNGYESGAITDPLSASAIGMWLEGNQNATGNRVHYVYGGAGFSNAVGSTGIYWRPTTAGCVLDSNFVSGITAVSTNTTGGCLITGIAIGSGGTGTGASSTVRNNMVRLGITSGGANFTLGSQIWGIMQNLDANMKYMHNSVYIGGTGVSNSGNTAAFKRNVKSASLNDSLINNIFVNNRSNGSGSGNHYCVDLTGTSGGNTRLASDYNLYYYNGTGGHILYDGVNTRNAFPLITSGGAPISDWNSGFGDPNFVNPTGTDTTGGQWGNCSPCTDLHLQGTTPAEAAGYAGFTATTDYDGETRASFTPVDMGADAGNFTASDIIKPGVKTTINSSVFSLCSGNINPVITAYVSDMGSGIDLNSNPPRLWYRKSLPTPDPSWTSVGASSSSGTANYDTLIYNLSISAAYGETYEYYVAAQDLASNIGFSRFDATTPVHASVSSQTTAPNSGVAATFTTPANAPLSGTVTVAATGATYSSLTNAGGLFSAINTSGLSGNLIVSVTGDVSGETGTYNLAQWTEYCGSGYTVTIQPDAATVRTISGATFTEMINIRASRVIIDGRYNGSGKYLKFYNSQTGGSQDVTLSFSNNAANDTVRYCDIVSSCNVTTGGGAVGVILLNSAHDIVLDNNLIHGNTLATNIISAYSNSNCYNITISNNEIYNIGLSTVSTSIRSSGIWVQSGNGSNWNITGNSIYNTNVNSYNVQTAIDFSPGSSSTGNTISGNWIGGSAAQCGACSGCGNNMWKNSYSPTSTEMQHIGINVSAGSGSIIRNNTIKRIWISNPYYSGYIGVNIAGSTEATVSKNTFGGTFPADYYTNPSSADMIEVDGGAGATYPGYIYGIWSRGTGATFTADSNTFNYLVQNGSVSGGLVNCITHTGSGVAVITNNVNAADGTSLHQEAWGIGYNSNTIRLEPSASTSGNLISNNIVSTVAINGADISQVASNGIYVNIASGLTVSGTISNNRVTDAYNLENSGYTEGIYVTTQNGNSSSKGNWDIYNNMVYLSNPGQSLIRTEMEGIDVQLNTGSTTNVYYNTVWIDGINRNNTSSLANPSMSFYIAPGLSGSSGTTRLRNNIFINTRQGGSPNSDTYHVPIWHSSSSTSGWSSDSNLFMFRTGGTYNRLAIWNLNAMYNLSTWQSYSGTDANSYQANWTTGTSSFSGNSLNPSGLFTLTGSNSNLHISTADGESYQFAGNRAAPLASVTTDIDGQLRSATTPDLGADQFNTCTPPATPSVSVVNNCGSSVLSTTATGTLLWSNAETTSSITVSAGGTYSVTQTVAGCSSAAGSGVAAPLAVPAAPSVSVTNNCNGTSVLSTTATGTLLWSNAETTSSITVSTGGSYTVTQTVSGCVSAAGIGTAAPGTTPATPVVTAVNNCNGTSTLSTSATGSLLWNTGATTSSITVTAAGTYSVTATSGSCTSAAGSASASLGSCNVAFTVKFFMQGYYLGGGKMSPFLKLLGQSSSWNTTDSATIELRNITSPYAVAHSYTGIVNANGNMACTFAAGAVGNSYYVVIKHRNSLETWSKNPVNIVSSGNYDFTTAATQAYNDNMVNLGGGVYGIYSGDVNQDGFINNVDKVFVNGASYSFNSGVTNASDVTGDGRVDASDLRVVTNNVAAGLSKQRP